MHFILSLNSASPCKNVPSRHGGTGSESQSQFDQNRDRCISLKIQQTTSWYIFFFLIFLFPQKIGFDISCKLDPWMTICMKFKAYFLVKIRKILSTCRSVSAYRMIDTMELVNRGQPLMRLRGCAARSECTNLLNPYRSLGYSRRQIDYIFLFFTENRIWYFMQSVSIRKHLWRISKYYTIIEYWGIWYDVLSTMAEKTNIGRGDNRGQYWYSVLDINVISNTSIINNCFII